MKKIKFAAETNKGKIRKNNEDSYLATGKVFAVADGMGGHQAGEIASRIAVDILKDAQEDLLSKDTEVLLKESFSKVNSVIFQKAEKNAELKGMGTTLTVAVIKPNQVLLGHAGDSRVYLLDESNFSLLTEDHSLVAQMVKEGQISKSEAEDHPMKSMITRALGAGKQIEVDTGSVEVKSGNKLLLATDGLTNMLTDEEIASAVKLGTAPKKICHNLVKMANRKGGTDNITTVLIEIE